MPMSFRYFLRESLLDKIPTSKGDTKGAKGTDLHVDITEQEQLTFCFRLRSNCRAG